MKLEVRPQVRLVVSRDLCGSGDVLEATNDPGCAEATSPIQRFRSIIQYDGTDFSGFQRQVASPDWNLVSNAATPYIIEL